MLPIPGDRKVVPLRNCRILSLTRTMQATETHPPVRARQVGTCAASRLSSSCRSQHRGRRNHVALGGFTIVELLVVIAIIAILAGLLISGLRGAIGASRKSKEIALLRGIHAAWQLYADNSGEALLPGYLDVPTQTAWNVSYKNASKQTVALSMSQTYPWRLAGFMGKDLFNAYLGYSETAAADPDQEVTVDWSADSTGLPGWMSGTLGQPGSAVALQPAFGYNAYYVGGWYTQLATGVSEPAFSNASWTDVNGGARQGGLVATRLSHIRRTSEVVIFASSTVRDPGNYRDDSGEENYLAGSAWVVPPMLGQTQVWQPFMGNPQNVGMAGGDEGTAAFMPQSSWTDTGILQVFVTQSVPIRRHNRKVAVIHADGSASGASIGELMDMRRWIDAADQADFTHQNN